MKSEVIETKLGIIHIPQPESYFDVLTLIASDNYRKTERFSRVGALLTILKFGNLAWFRLCQKRDLLSPFKNKIYSLLNGWRNIDLSIETKVGYGFYLGHNKCIVINGKTIIGNNVSISQFVNIGSSKGLYAKICDGAYIAPMSCLVEDVTIGEDAVIGAGSVVTHDVPPHTTFAGCPAKKISEKSNNHWHFYYANNI